MYIAIYLIFVVVKTEYGTISIQSLYIMFPSSLARTGKYINLVRGVAPSQEVGFAAILRDHSVVTWGNPMVFGKSDG